MMLGSQWSPVLLLGCLGLPRGEAGNLADKGSVEWERPWGKQRHGNSLGLRSGFPECFAVITVI